MILGGISFLKGKFMVTKRFPRKSTGFFITLLFFHPQISLTYSKAPQSKADGDCSAWLKAQIPTGVSHITARYSAHGTQPVLGWGMLSVLFFLHKAERYRFCSTRRESKQLPSSAQG